MNTIFLEITKRCLGDIIEEAMGQSLQADVSFLNLARDRLGVSRDKGLSETKRENLRVLKLNIMHYQSQSGRDEDSFKSISVLIQNYQAEMADLLRAKCMSLGNTDQAVVKALNFIQLTYKQFERAHLLDTSNDQQPHHVFKLFLGNYFALKILEQLNLTSIQDLTDHPIISNYRARASIRETLIMDTIKKCTEEVAALTSHSRESQDLCRRFVLDKITLLEQAEADLNQKYGMGLALTRSLLNALHLTHRDDHLLLDQLKKARQALQPSQTLKPQDEEWEDVQSHQLRAN